METFLTYIMINTDDGVWVLYLCSYYFFSFYNQYSTEKKVIWASLSLVKVSLDKSLHRKKSPWTSFPSDKGLLVPWTNVALEEGNPLFLSWDGKSELSWTKSNNFHKCCNIYTNEWKSSWISNKGICERQLSAPDQQVSVFVKWQYKLADHCIYHTSRVTRYLVYDLIRAV